MSEQEAVYKTETQEALEMLGVGYDKKQPSVIIQPKRKATALMEGGLAEYDVWGWVKVSANFINHIQKLSGANLKCWLVISLAIDEFGKCKLTIKQLQLLTKLSHTEVINSTKELEEMGYLNIKRNARGNEYEPVFVARGVGNDPSESVVKKVESTVVYQVESTPQIEKLHPSIKELKELSVNSKPEIPQNMPMDWYILNNLDIPAHVEESHKIEHDAILAFEASFSALKPLLWYCGKPKWTHLRKDVVELYKADPQCFEKYKVWRTTPYVKGAVSLKDIQRDPDCFMASWAGFVEANPTEINRAEHTDEKGLPLT